MSTGCEGEAIVLWLAFDHCRFMVPMHARKRKVAPHDHQSKHKDYKSTVIFQSFPSPPLGEKGLEFGQFPLPPETRTGTSRSEDCW